MFAPSQQNAYICFGKAAFAAPVLKWEEFWFQVKGFWLELQKKGSQKAIYSIPLDLSSLGPGYDECKVVNSLVVETSAHTGKMKFFISSTNRVDILKLYTLVNHAAKTLGEAVRNKQIEQSFSCTVEMSVGFLKLGKSKFPLSISRSGIAVDNLNIAMDDILSLSPKQNDSHCLTKLVCTYKEKDGFHTKEFTLESFDDQQNIIGCYLVNKKASPPIPN